MSWRRLSVLASLITLLIFAGVARGQGRYELPEQGPQPLQNDLPEQGPQPLQGDLANPEQPGLNGPKSIDQSGFKTTNQKAPTAAGIQKSAKGASPKPDSFGPASGQHGVQQAGGPQIGVSRSGLLNMGNNQVSNPGSTSFLDGYLLRSLHDDGLARKKPAGEDKPKDDLLLPGKTSSKF
ncbi:MAG: hypothetical protein ACLQLE_12040 [Desulfobaccales bacterium]